MCNFFARSRLPTECRAILAVDSSKSILPYIPFDSIGIDSEPYVSQHKIVVYVLWHSLVWHPCTFHVCWHREREKEIEWENRRNQEKKKNRVARCVSRWCNYFRKSQSGPTRIEAASVNAAIYTAEQRNKYVAALFCSIWLKWFRIDSKSVRSRSEPQNSFNCFEVVNLIRFAVFFAPQIFSDTFFFCLCSVVHKYVNNCCWSACYRSWFRCFSSFIPLQIWIKFVFVLTTFEI